VVDPLSSQPVVRGARPAPDTPATALRAGATSAVSLLIGVMPWGLVTGVSMVGAGLSPLQAVAMGVLVFAGAAQIAVLPLYVAGAPLWVLYATTVVISLRYVIYGAVLAPYFGRLSWRWRALLSYVMVDGMFALFVGRFRPYDEQPHRHWFFLGGSIAMWIVWQGASWAGIFGGRLIPAEWSLDAAATLALVVPLLHDRAVVCGALTAGGVALAGAGLPMNLGTLAGVAAGILTGLLVSRLSGPGDRPGRGAAHDD
jgi:predicted branched-subunit amino acid permease